MSKQTKNQKRKAEVVSNQQQTDMLVRALTELCAPSLPEYIDDSKGIDLTGRTILYRLGMLAWNLALGGDQDFEAYLRDYASLDEADREMIHQEVELLRRRKQELYPKNKTRICDVSVVLKGGKPCLKLKYHQISGEFSLPEEVRLADELMAELEKLGTEEEAERLRSYHKVDHRYFGVRVPAITRIADEFAVQHSQSEILSVCGILWKLKCHEAFLAAGKLLRHNKVSDGREIWRLLDVWKESFDSWAMADVLMQSAHKVLKNGPEYFDTMEKEWLNHSNFWVRRTCLTFTLYSAKPGSQPDRSLKWAAQLADDPEWFVQKAVGWYLRELSKCAPETVKTFLQQNAEKMKRFAVREASKYL